MGCMGFFTLGFTVVIVLGFTFKSIVFFYSTDEKLEQTMKLILTITDTKRIIKWILCKICRIKISVVKCFFFNPCVRCGSSWQYTVPGFDLLHFYLSKLIFIDCSQCHFLNTKASLLYALNSFSCFL